MNKLKQVRILGALQTIAGLTASPGRRRALRDQMLWITELAERTFESAHDRARIDTRLVRVREALEAETALCAGKEKQTKNGAAEALDGPRTAG